MKTQILLPLVALLSFTPLIAQEMPMDDPFVQNSNRQLPPGPANISICYEDFSLPLAMAAKLQRENLTDAEFYQRIVEQVGKEVTQETLCVTRTRSNFKASVESNSERIYPTEYQPGTMPVSLTIDGAVTPEVAKFCRIPATPTSFETRNTGFTMEVEATFGENHKLVNLQLAPEHVMEVGEAEAGTEISRTALPTFETQRLVLAAVVQVDVPFLIGTMNRTSETKQDPDSANKVWFAFVTATLLK